MLSWGKVLLLLGFVQCFAQMTVEGYNAQRVRRDYHRSDDITNVVQLLEERISALENHEEEEAHDHHASLFSVVRSAGNELTAIGVPIVYDQVLLNREGGYNSTTGIFTCPIAGVYFFTYTALPSLGAETSVILLKGNTQLSNIYSDLLDGSTQLSEHSELVLLEVGDKVCVQLEQGSLLTEKASLTFLGYRVSD